MQKNSLDVNNLKIKKEYKALIKGKSLNQFTLKDFELQQQYIQLQFKEEDITKTSLEELEGLDMLSSSRKAALLFKAFYEMTNHQKKKWLTFRECHMLLNSLVGRKVSRNWVSIRMNQLVRYELVEKLVSKFSQDKRKVAYAPSKTLIKEPIILKMYMKVVDKRLGLTNESN